MFVSFSIEKFTCVVVFIICEDWLYTETGMEECEKLALIPDHAKLVVSPPRTRWKGIVEVPETLHIVYGRDHGGGQVLTRMIEIFNKRWQTLDLISMIQELKRATATHHRRYYRSRYISINDSLSTLPIFQKKEEEHSS